MTERRRVGRPTRAESGLSPKVLAALELRAGGCTWAEAAQLAKITPTNLRKWRDTPEAQQWLDRRIRENLDRANTKLVDSAPAVADRLLEIALSRDVKPYSAVNACEAIFKIIQSSVIEQEQRRQLQKIRQQLADLESGGPVIDV